ncbi:MAG: SDR family NAD(P)-dependent oxidoreductase [Pseudobdellovibrionaceae bacterium]
MLIKWALITGATAGIGEATAEKLAEGKVNLILTGRREEQLGAVKKRLEKYAVEVVTAAFDLTQKNQVLKFAESYAGYLEKLDVLVNNAGLALGTEKLNEAKLEDWDTMIDTNIKGLLYLTRQVLPHMLKKKSGHIVNMGSVAGRYVYPGGGVYCATKFAVRALSESLRLDVHGTGIRVTNIEPGMVETEFSKVRFKGDSDKAAKIYAGMTPLKAKDIADTIVWTLTRPAHVNIQELVIYPTDQASTRDVHRV